MTQQEIAPGGEFLVVRNLKDQAKVHYIPLASKLNLQKKKKRTDEAVQKTSTVVFGRGHTQAEAHSQNQRYKDLKGETELDIEAVAFNDLIALQSI